VEEIFLVRFLPISTVANSDLATADNGLALVLAFLLGIGIEGPFWFFFLHDFFKTSSTIVHVPLYHYSLDKVFSNGVTS